jgi:protein-tyrosine-phosphatase/predicted ATP-grasp superfamily ATP-dependent carboligase
MKPAAHAAPAALVIGSDTRAFLGVVRSLGRQGVTVHVAPFDHASAAMASRYIHRVHRLPPLQLDPEGWITALLGVCEIARPDFVVPCDDRSIIPLQHFHDRVAHLRLGLPGPQAYAAFFDKGHTRALAERCGVPVAPGRVLSEADTAEQLVADFGLPLFVKPRNSYLLRALESRRNVHPCHDVAALREVLASIPRRDEYLVEANFQGTGVGVSVLARDGVVSQAFQHRRVREPVGGGGSSYRKSEALSPELEAMTLALAQASRLDGVAMFEYKVDDATGRQVLLEVNARFWGSLPLAMAAGVDFPWLWFQQAQGAPVAPRVRYRVPCYARNLLSDLYATVGHIESRRTDGRGVQLAEGLRWLGSFHRVLIGRESLDTLARDDPQPAWAEFRTIGQRFAERYTRALPWVRQRRAAELRQALEGAWQDAAQAGRSVHLVVACFGNICRSPYAALRLTQQLPNADVSGAALACRAPRPSPTLAVESAARRGLDLAAHRSRYADDELLQQADLVIVFDSANLELLAARGLRLRRPPVRLGELRRPGDGRVDIADPVDGDVAFFDRTYALIDEACAALARDTGTRR